MVTTLRKTLICPHIASNQTLSMYIQSRWTNHMIHFYLSYFTLGAIPYHSFKIQTVQYSSSNYIIPFLASTPSCPFHRSCTQMIYTIHFGFRFQMSSTHARYSEPTKIKYHCTLQFKNTIRILITIMSTISHNRPFLTHSHLNTSCIIIDKSASSI